MSLSWPGNGPEAATAFLGISAAAVCAPLNPSYARAEHDFYLADLHARALVVDDALDTPARDAALELGVAVIDLRVEHAAAAGTFTFGGALDPGDDDDARDPDAPALVLHTSGTTSRPKLVPLTPSEPRASAANVASVLGLSDADRCLNVMPLFHIHGLVAALLASLRSGGSVACTPGFHPLRFFDWVRELRPTWTTAVPTMHQAVLNARVVTRRSSLAWRSASCAPRPRPSPSVLEGLEEMLGIPVIEAYGMTEAAHQMASNPLPPSVRKSGSVGRAAGPEIAILDSDGRLLPAGETGEVAIRGDNVFGGYDSNPAANAASFTNGWFRTGDQGRIDEDGYLISAGGSRRSSTGPGRRSHRPRSTKCSCDIPPSRRRRRSAIPDTNDSARRSARRSVCARARSATERELQDFVAQTIAPFKVPRVVAGRGRDPEGGHRQGAACRARRRARPLGRAALLEPGRSAFLEESLRAIWADVLGFEDVEPSDDFFGLGGDSILGAEAVARVRELVGDPDLPLLAIVRAPTPRGMSCRDRRPARLDGRRCRASSDRATNASSPCFSFTASTGT